MPKTKKGNDKTLITPKSTMKHKSMPERKKGNKKTSLNSKIKPMEWPSKKVPRGGLMQPAVNNYDPATHEFLKLLINESKMTTMQNSSKYTLRSTDSTPSLGKQNVEKYPVIIRPGSSKKRSMETIVNSGVYEREQYRPIHPAVDREKEKEKLQNKMAYNNDVVVKKNKTLEKKTSKEAREDLNRFDQLVQEIKERENWLKEMERLGQGEKYRQIIELQIQEKIREMQKMKTCDNV